jgi:phage terminase large subunit
VQKSIKNSVHRLLADKIEKFGLQNEFEILETEIRAKNGSIIIFQGMQNHTADSIKSLEAYDLVWVEEAQTLSEFSFNILRPTLRQLGSELWFSWNPRFKTDPVDKFFRRNPPDNAISVNINWEDNPWFRTGTELYADMLADYERDPDTAEHIWGGAYGAGKGSILAKWINKARKEKRINSTAVYDPDGAPVEISSDLGFRDTTTWWFWQRKRGGFTVFRAMGGSGYGAEDWIEALKDEMIALNISPDRLGKIWLPHDARAKTFQSKHSSVEQFIKAFGVDRVGVVAQSKKEAQVNAARTIIDQCEINETACSDGLDGLEAWEFEYNEDTQAFSREPLHNWASHWGDGFAYGCQVMQELPPPTPKGLPGRTLVVRAGEGYKSTITMDDAWATQETVPSGRIR